MATNEKIKSDIQTLNVDSPKIDLFILDATSLGGTTYYFTPMTDGQGESVVFNGITYQPLPVEFKGMENRGDGRLPRPKMRVANVSLTFIGLVNSYQDALGAKVTRIRTFKKYLDGETEADTSAQFPVDVFYIEHKTIQNKYLIEWELVSPIDIGHKMLPRGQAIPYCQHRYRVYRSGAFDYSLATCPYTGTNYFDQTGASTTIDEDMCGKKLSDCELRYPNDDDQLPMKGFPGIGQVGRAYR